MLDASRRRGRRTRISPGPEIRRAAAWHSDRDKGQLRHRRHAHDGRCHRRLCRRDVAEGCHHGGQTRAAGAILLGKTNLDEYAPAGIGRSTLGGQTCNPYDTKRITGGSSAGSAAAVAANLAICASVRLAWVGALSVLAQCAGRDGRDAGAGTRRHRATDALTRPRPDVPHRRGHRGYARSAHRR